MCFIVFFYGVVVYKPQTTKQGDLGEVCAVEECLTKPEQVTGSI